MNLHTILALLPKVGPIIAAAPEFRKLVEEVIDTLTSEREQGELQAAYEDAVSNAADAHMRLQAAIARNS